MYVWLSCYASFWPKLFFPSFLNLNIKMLAVVVDDIKENFQTSTGTNFFFLLHFHKQMAIKGNNPTFSKKDLTFSLYTFNTVNLGSMLSDLSKSLSPFEANISLFERQYESRIDIQGLERASWFDWKTEWLLGPNMEAFKAHVVEKISADWKKNTLSCDVRDIKRMLEIRDATDCRH